MSGRAAAPVRPDRRRLPSAAVIHSLTPRGRTYPQPRVRPTPRRRRQRRRCSHEDLDIDQGRHPRQEPKPSSAPPRTPSTPNDCSSRPPRPPSSARADATRPRYTLHIDGQLTAIVQTGDDDLGLPDHAGAAATARATEPHPKPVRALITSPPQPRDISPAPRRCAAPTPDVLRDPGCALARVCPPGGGHRARCPLTF